jgi:hypothetical protein
MRRSLLAGGLLAGFLAVSPARGQTELDRIRSDMEEQMRRLSQVETMLFRSSLQDPALQDHVQLVSSMTQSVQTDLDYLEALLQLYGLAGDPAAAGAVVLRELAGARQRLLLDEYEQHVESEENSAATGRGLQALERQILEELRRVTGLYDRASALVGGGR